MAKTSQILRDQKRIKLIAKYAERRAALRKKLNDALKAAQSYIQPESEVIVVVGRAAEVVPMLEKIGPVRVVDVEGVQLKPSAPAAIVPPVIVPP